MIARDADQLVVFQRTPNFSVPARNRPLTDEDHESFDEGLDAYLSSLEQSDFGRVPPSAFTAEVPPRDVQRARYEQLWQEGGSGGFLKAFPNILVHPDVNEVCADFVRQKIRETVKNPKTAAALSPSGYPFGVKRLCVDTDYFDTYNRPNVELVNLREEPIERITAVGVDTASRHFELDALVFATGFDAVTGALLAVDIRGRNGATLKDAWSEGPQTYLGLTVKGFPNLFTITGPGSPSVIGNVITNCEYHVDWIAECLTHMRQHDLATIEPDGEAQIAWGRHVAEVADRTLFPKANSWYLGVNIPRQATGLHAVYRRRLPHDLQGGRGRRLQGLPLRRLDTRAGGGRQMSRLFGPVRQNGYVVRDIEAAMKHWIEVLQVGPWFYIDRVQTDWFRHRGQDSTVELSIALANSGDLQIELIQQRNDAPSMYKEFLDSGREGLQHVAFWSTDYQSPVRPCGRPRIQARPRRPDRR
jgi:hypothetical protein